MVNAQETASLRLASTRLVTKVAQAWQSSMGRSRIIALSSELKSYRNLVILRGVPEGLASDFDGPAVAVTSLPRYAGTAIFFSSDEMDGTAY
jgi:hypothetical protein